MKSIVIIGLGAIGSHAAIALRNAGKLKLVDFDAVEQKNTLSQLHTKMGLRKNKAQALQQLLNGMWGIKAQGFQHKVTDDNVAIVLAGADLVLDCTDNIAARTCIKTFCDASKTPLLHGAMSADGKFALAEWTDQFEPDPETGDGATCEDGENVAFHIIVGGFVAQAAKTFLDTGRQLSFQITPSGVRRT
jgi:molybdopterin-synthase adenylyltransferase